MSDNTEALEALKRKHQWDCRPVRDEAEQDSDTIRAALESPSVPEWQPIETAPKDVAPILVYTSAFYGQPTLSYDVAWWNGFCFESRKGLIKKATHWMPLPDPPGD